MEESIARVFQVGVAIAAAFSVALWFALSVWTYRDITQRSENMLVQIFSTLVVVVGFIPGVLIYLLLRPKDTLEERYQRAIEEDYLEQELNSLPLCPTCRLGIRDEYIFCPRCGSVLRRTCTKCGRLVDSDWVLCAYCGTDLPERAGKDADSADVIPVPAASNPDRGRIVSVPTWEIDMEDDIPGSAGGDTGELPPDAAINFDDAPPVPAERGRRS